MTREQRLQLLGAQTVAEIHRQVAQAPPLTPQQIDRLRRVFAATQAPRPSRRAAA